MFEGLIFPWEGQWVFLATPAVDCQMSQSQLAFERFFYVFNVAVTKKNGCQFDSCPPANSHLFCISATIACVCAAGLGLGCDCPQ